MVQIVRPGERSYATAQTPGMRRGAGVCGELTGSSGLWMGHGENAAGAASGVHHHGASESGIYVLRGRIRFRWGPNLEFVADTEAGDFIYVPPFEIHMEENLDPDAAAEFVLARNTQDAIVVNVDDPRELLRRLDAERR